MIEDLRDRLEEHAQRDELSTSPEDSVVIAPLIQVLVSDVSARGARLSGKGLPEQNSLVRLRADELCLEARVAWSSGNACGLELKNHSLRAAFLPSSAAASVAKSTCYRSERLH